MQKQFGAWLMQCNGWLSQHERRERLVHSPAGHKSSALQYERRIVEQGEIETRDDRHDSMNALVWLQFPLAKRALSRLHVEQSMASENVPCRGSERGPKRDAATLFDEHGLVVLARQPSALSLLQDRQWTDAWFTNRATFLQETRLVVFGHALLERLASPYKGLTGHAMLLLWPEADWPSLSQLDQVLEVRISALSSPRDLLACPLMGWPGYAAGARIWLTTLTGVCSGQRPCAEQQGPAQALLVAFEVKFRHGRGRLCHRRVLPVHGGGHHGRCRTRAAARSSPLRHS